MSVPSSCEPLLGVIQALLDLARVDGPIVLGNDRELDPVIAMLDLHARHLLILLGGAGAATFAAFLEGFQQLGLPALQLGDVDLDPVLCFLDLCFHTITSAYVPGAQPPGLYLSLRCRPMRSMA